ncbi:MAG TPA: GNAT family N-acetyltransferase [Verrucomicrobiae bacterium]|nr:GNAT family N-acetyltransferase [Verrucomicrobiae bacterium]
METILSPATGATIQPAETQQAAPPRQINPLSDPEWERLATAYANASIFHGTEWLRTLADSYGYTPLCLVAGETGAPSALWPIMEVNSRLTGRRGVSLPFTDDCQPLYDDFTSAQRLAQSALELGRSRGWKSLEFRGGRELFPEAPASLAFYGHSVNLTGGEEYLFSRLESSVRRAIRKAEKSGVTVTAEQGTEAMDIFYSLQCRTRRKHGLPPQPRSFFQNIWRHLVSKNLGMIVIARFQNRPIAASVYFRRGGRAIYKYGASDETFQQLRGANLVMWEAIKRLARDGARSLDLGRTSLSNEGLRRFKLGWGATEHKIEYVKYDFHRSTFVTERDEATGWYNVVFRTLPLGLSRLVGAVLYRHWA